jgi:hypothetical protein
MKLAPATLAAALFIGALAPAAGQIQIGTVRGAFRDEAGGALEGVAATLENRISGYRRGVVSGPDGRFAFHNVPPQTYTLRAERAGFQPAVQTVAVRSNVPLELEVRLRVRGADEGTLVVPGRELVDEGSSSSKTEPV